MWAFESSVRFNRKTMVGRYPLFDALRKARHDGSHAPKRCTTWGGAAPSDATPPLGFAAAAEQPPCI